MSLLYLKEEAHIEFHSKFLAILNLLAFCFTASYVELYGTMGFEMQ